MSYELGLRCVPEILRFALDDNPGFQRCTQRPYFLNVPEIPRFALDDNPRFHVARSVPTLKSFSD